MAPRTKAAQPGTTLERKPIDGAVQTDVVALHDLDLPDQKDSQQTARQNRPELGLSTVHNATKISE